MDKKRCPYCGEEIQASAKKCRFCGEWLSETGSPAQSVTGNPVDVSQQIPPVQEEPRHNLEIRYEGDSSDSFFKEYFVGQYIHRYADFRGYTSRKTFWMAYLAYIIVSIGVAGLILLLSAVGGATGVVVSFILAAVFSLGLAVPQLALCCRRLRDAGKSPYSIFLGLIPAVGSIILLVYFCQPTSYYDPETEKQIDGHDEPPVKFSPADWGILGGCVVLFVAGCILLMSSLGTMLGGFDSTSGYDLGEYSDEADEYILLDEDEALFDTSEYPVEVAAVVEPSNSGFFMLDLIDTNFLDNELTVYRMGNNSKMEKLFYETGSTNLIIEGVGSLNDHSIKMSGWITEGGTIHGRYHNANGTNLDFNGFLSPDGSLYIQLGHDSEKSDWYLHPVGSERPDAFRYEGYWGKKRKPTYVTFYEADDFN